MKQTTSSKSEEIDRNLERFLAILPTLLPDHAGEYALLRQGAVVGFFPSALDAQIAGNRQFDDELFSIQPVDDCPGHLGYFAYAVDPRCS